eukprot:TRINITY_DN2650_c3_g1_i1.p1 TRINITY_DN2650_c3_g1~~TRINITY_DN2650_c3_g1_i1.p1  ORF type:complete len:498 (+),score=222.53 TRINITY_DN2650_c3_g1_i1:130-1623(+)
MTEINDPSVVSKAEKMKAKNDYVNTTFRLNDEVVVQDYHCSLKRTFGTQGRVWITYNYICFIPTLGSQIEVIPLKNIVRLDKTSGLIFGSNIEIHLQNGAQYTFGSFMHRDEAFEVLYHLWKHPPSYIEIAPPTPASNATPNSQFNMNNSSIPQASNLNNNSSQGFRRATKNANNQNNQANGLSIDDALEMGQVNRINTNASREAVQIALEVRQMGVDALNELTNQAEMIDRIEVNVEKIHANLDRGDRYMRGIETVGGAFKNIVSKQKLFVGSGQQDRTISVERKPEVVNVEILLKNADDSLTPCLLRFSENEFGCFTHDNQLIKGCSWSYDFIEQLVMRSRPQHMDIRFKQNAPRFRLMSAFLQGITNELVLRCPDAKIAFEPNSKKFQFGSFAISEKTFNLSARAALMNGNSETATKTSSLLSDNASPEMRAILDQQDKDLQIVSSVVSDLSGITTAIGTEVRRQNEQLDKVTGRVDEANNRMLRSNQRMNNLS